MKTLRQSKNKFKTPNRSKKYTINNENLQLYIELCVCAESLKGRARGADFQVRGANANALRVSQRGGSRKI